MTNILDQVAARASRFVPIKPREYLALQIARRLGEQGKFRHYLVLFEHYPEELLLDIYRRCAREGNLTGEHFLRTLTEITQ